MSVHRVRSPLQIAAIVVGPLAAVAAAWLMSLGIDDHPGGLTEANVALVMAAITVAFALADWPAGVTTSIGAALSLNYFHTEPVHSLQVTDSRDVLSIMLLALLGLSVSAATAFRVRRTVHHIRAADEDAAGARLEELLVHDSPAQQVWSAAIASPANDLGLVLARVEESAPATIPTIGRPVGDNFASHEDVVLPVYGGALRLEPEHSAGRWLVLTPRDGLGPLTLDRRSLLAFADTVQRALWLGDLVP